MADDSSRAPARHFLETLGDDAFRHLVDAAPDALLVVDPDGRIAFANQQTLSHFGYAPTEIVGQPIEILIPERYRRGHLAHRNGYMDTPRVRPMGSGLELFGARKDGSEFPVEISLSPMETDEGRYVCAAIRDITERKQAEMVEHHLAAIVDSSDDAIISKDLEGTIKSWNRGARRIFGYEADEVVGRHIAILFPPGHEHEERQVIERLQGGDTLQHYETLRRRKDGRTIDVSLTISPIYDALDRVVGVSTVARDVTERKQMEAATRRANQLLLNAVESFEGAFAVFDAKDRLVICNSGFRILFGRVIEGDIVGCRQEDLLEANLRAGTFDLGDETPAVFRARWLSYHREPTGELEMRTAEGQTLRVVNRRTSDGGRVSTAFDITSDVERESELRMARALAEAASAAKSEFLASMSHELRTPLNAVLGFAQLLSRDRKDPLTERQRERLAHVTKGGEHLLRLIDDVLDLARIEAGRVTISIEPVSVPDVLDHVKTTLAPMAERIGVHLEFDPAPPGLQVLADRTRFAQVLMNYGSNAIKYGRPGGHAKITVDAFADRVRVVVRDDGIGIPEDKQAVLFQPFQRAGQETGSIEGTGIGLAISKRLAEIMSGAVGFSSDAGVGSSFWIELPRYEADRVPSELPEATSSDTSSLAGPVGERHVIVYVEDNPSNIAFMEDFLADFERITLLTAPTAEIGLELARARRPDLVIMDMHLPGMSGFEATRKLQDWPETRDIPVVALSAAAMIRDAKRVEDAGFYRYLTKPVQLDELASVLEELLVHRKHAVDPPG